jgi:hypothetical protein
MYATTCMCILTPLADLSRAIDVQPMSQQAQVGAGPHRPRPGRGRLGLREVRADAELRPARRRSSATQAAERARVSRRPERPPGVVHPSLRTPSGGVRCSIGHAGVSGHATVRGSIPVSFGVGRFLDTSRRPAILYGAMHFGVVGVGWSGVAAGADVVGSSPATRSTVFPEQPLETVRPR